MASCCEVDGDCPKLAYLVFHGDILFQVPIRHVGKDDEGTIFLDDDADEVDHIVVLEVHHDGRFLQEVLQLAQGDVIVCNNSLNLLDQELWHSVGGGDSSVNTLLIYSNNIYSI